MITEEMYERWIDDIVEHGGVIPTDTMFELTAMNVSVPCIAARAASRLND